MSTLREKLRVHESQKSLKDRLCEIGVPPLSHTWVERAMGAAALRLSPNAWKWQIEWRKRSRSGLDTWKVFPLKEYLKLHDDYENRNLTPVYGVPIPTKILDRIGVVQKRLPHARIEVHALESDDPYVFVTDGDDKECIAGWYGRNTMQRVYLG